MKSTLSVYPRRQLTRLLLLSVVFLGGAAQAARADEAWAAQLDSDVRFYYPTALGVIVAGTDRSLYAIDGETGEILWRRKDVRLDATDAAHVPGTDLLLLNLEQEAARAWKRRTFFPARPCGAASVCAGS
ncbi:MAG: hypothetical protein WKF30_16355 [Pyrinomonadaceae bacterium]